MVDEVRSALQMATPLTRFIGRDAAIEAVCDLVGRERLVTLTGSGGCGKTRLAMEVARRVGETFDDGVVVTELAPVDTGTLVASVLATSTGVSESGGGPVLTLTCNSLASRNLLVVLDNCEHLVDSCAEVVAALLTHCPGVRVLATSRTPLGVDGEATWLVPSLSLPSDANSDAVAEIEASESGQLLLDRARLARPGFVITDAEAPDIIAICRRLDGIPLAIELAATRLRALSVNDLTQGLEHRFSLLRGSRLAPPRQRTIEASIEWSYDLLDEAARVLLTRLSVFAGSFTIDAVERVCTDEMVPNRDVRAVVAGLVDHSLVQLEDGSAPCYRLLESVRAYARAQMASTGDAPQWRDRHLDHVRALTSWYHENTETADLAAANARVDSAMAEVRAAVEWGLRSGRADDASAIVADLRLFWFTAERNQEGRRWLDAVIAAETTDPGPRTQTETTRARLAASQLALVANDPFVQYELASTALESIVRLGLRELEPMARAHLGWAQIFLAPDDAPSMLEAAHRLAADLGDDARQEHSAFGRGVSAVFTGDLALATEHLELGASIAIRTNSIGRHWVRALLGYTRVLEGRLSDAGHLLDQVLSEEAGFDRAGFDLAHVVQGIASAMGGRWDEARARLEDVARRAASALRNPSLYAQVHLAMVERSVGNAAGCHRHLDEIEAYLSAPGLGWFRAQALTWRGDVTAADGHPDAAMRYWTDAMAVAEETRNPLARSIAHRGLARAAILTSDLDRALTHARDALRLAVDAGYGIGVTDALETLAVLPGPERGSLLAAVDAERTRTGYVRPPIEEPDYQAAVADLGNLPAPPMSLAEAVAVAAGGNAGQDQRSMGWDSLSPAELRVAHLVAEGLTNPQVGERLFISRRTVQAHLSHIYAKLDLSNRAELAAVVATHTDRRR